MSKIYDTIICLMIILEKHKTSHCDMVVSKHLSDNKWQENSAFIPGLFLSEIRNISILVLVRNCVRGFINLQK